MTYYVLNGTLNPTHFTSRLGFVILHRRRSTEVNQTLHLAVESWVVHYIYTFLGSCPLTEFCQIRNSLCVRVFSSPILAALLHGISAVGVVSQAVV